MVTQRLTIRRSSVPDTTEERGALATRFDSRARLCENTATQLLGRKAWSTWN